MEETTTRHQLQAIDKVLERTPPKVPYRPRDPEIEAPPIAPAE